MVTSPKVAVAFEGDRPPSRPKRTFDEGRQVFIAFPRGIGQGDMPSLFIVDLEGDSLELVNDRGHGHSMIADRLFAAEPHVAAEDEQQGVGIMPTEGKSAP